MRVGGGGAEQGWIRTSFYLCSVGKDVTDIAIARGRTFRRCHMCLNFRTLRRCAMCEGEEEATFFTCSLRCSQLPSSTPLSHGERGGPQVDLSESMLLLFLQTCTSYVLPGWSAC